MGNILKFTCCVMLMCMIMVAPFSEAAVSCSSVASNLTPCFTYITGRAGPIPSGACCNGVRGLNNSARTTKDRQTACACLVGAARTIRGVNFGLAAALPSRCRVNVPYRISPNTDCSKVR